MVFYFLSLLSCCHAWWLRFMFSWRLNTPESGSDHEWTNYLTVVSGPIAASSLVLAPYDQGSQSVTTENSMSCKSSIVLVKHEGYWVDRRQRPTSSTYNLVSKPKPKADAAVKVPLSRRAQLHGTAIGLGRGVTLVFHQCTQKFK